MKPFARQSCQNFALFKNSATTNVGPFATYFVIDHFMAINYLKYRLMLLPHHNSARVSHVCCYFYTRTRGWNGCQSTKFILMAQIRNGTREKVISLFLTAHSRVNRSSKLAIATGLRAGQSMNFFFGFRHPKQLDPHSAPPNLVFEGYRENIVLGKWDAVWSWPLISIKHRD